MRRGPKFKPLPDGVPRGSLVVGNERFPAVFRGSPPDRFGEVVRGTKNPIEVDVLWRGTKHPQAVDVRLLRVVRLGPAAARGGRRSGGADVPLPDVRDGARPAPAAAEPTTRGRPRGPRSSAG